MLDYIKYTSKINFRYYMMLLLVLFKINPFFFKLKMWLLNNVSLHMWLALAACIVFLLDAADLGDLRNPNSSLESKGM